MFYLIRRLDLSRIKIDIVEGKLIFTTATENQATNTTESLSLADSRHGEQVSSFSPLATPFQSRLGFGNDLLSMPQQETRAADTAPSSSEMEDVLMNLRLNNDLLFSDVDHNPHNYFMGNNRAESIAPSHQSIWGEANNSVPKNGEMIDTFDFLIKSLSSANNYVSMLTRE